MLTLAGAALRGLGLIVGLVLDLMIVVWLVERLGLMVGIAAWVGLGIALWILLKPLEDWEQ